VCDSCSCVVGLNYILHCRLSPTYAAHGIAPNSATGQTLAASGSCAAGASSGHCAGRPFVSDGTSTVQYPACVWLCCPEPEQGRCSTQRVCGCVVRNRTLGTDTADLLRPRVRGDVAPYSGRRTVDVGVCSRKIKTWLAMRFASAAFTTSSMNSGSWLHPHFAPSASGTGTHCTCRIYLRSVICVPGSTRGQHSTSMQTLLHCIPSLGPHAQNRRAGQHIAVSR